MTHHVASAFLSDQTPITEAMLAVGSASQLEFCTRAAGVEVLLSLAERAPAIMRKCTSVAPGLLPLALVLACEVRTYPFSVRIHISVLLCSWSQGYAVKSNRARFLVVGAFHSFLAVFSHKFGTSRFVN